MQKSRRLAKYNQIRHPLDPFYSYYAFKTFFNKLTRQGRAQTGYRHLELALKGCKTLETNAPSMWVAERVMRTLWSPLSAGRTRKGKQIQIVPVPLRRNRKTIIARHRLVNTVYIMRHRRSMWEALRNEMVTTFNTPRSSIAMRGRKELHNLLYEHRTNMELRW